jgi:hypothetical protein
MDMGARSKGEAKFIPPRDILDLDSFRVSIFCCRSEENIKGDLPPGISSIKG